MTNDHIDHPFWSDDFDMDLPKVVPGARAIVGDIADVTLWTTGGLCKGRLNHPDVWNSDQGLVAFFGFHGAARPAIYHSRRDPVACTVWEAFRDAWPHNYVMLVEQQPVWDTASLWPQFQTIMWHQRRWGRTIAQRRAAEKAVIRSLTAAVKRLRVLHAETAGASA